MTRASPTRSIYPHREDSELLRPFARVDRGRWFLEIGCGEGRASLEAARQGARVVATDLNPQALHELAERARALGYDLAAVRTDLFHGLRRFDRILANPPYLPTPVGARDPDPWVNLALDGGPDGWAVTARILQELPEHLSPGADAFVLVSSRQSASRGATVRREWEAAGGELERVASREWGGETLEVWRLSLSTRRSS